MADETVNLVVEVTRERQEKLKAILAEKMPGFTVEDYVKFAILVCDEDFVEWLDQEDYAPDQLTDEEESAKLLAQIREWS